LKEVGSELRQHRRPPKQSQHGRATSRGRDLYRKNKGNCRARQGMKEKKKKLKITLTGGPSKKPQKRAGA